MSSLDPLYYTSHARLLYQHQLPWWRNILDACIGCHFGVAAGQLYFDWRAFGPDATALKILDMLVILVSVSSRVTWRSLFLDAHQFLYFRRPSNGYRRALITVTVCTVVLPFILHLWTIFLSFKAEIGNVLNNSLGTAIVKVLFFLAASSLYLWMVRKFLVGEDDEHYEPTMPLLPETQSTPLTPTISPNRSESSTPEVQELHADSTPPLPFDDGLLATSYFMQPKGAFSLPSNPSARHHLSLTETIGPPESSASAAVHSPDPVTQSEDDLPTHPLCCRTIARFDYVCESRIGINSWLTYPLVSWILAIYSTILLAMVCNLIYENKYSRLPSPKARTSLRAPIGGYLFCAFSVRYRIRKSLFLRSDLSLPSPWIKIKSLFGKAVFKNSESGTTANVDPCLRAFPVKEHDPATGIKSPTYLTAYNSGSDHPLTCNNYWGHQGRKRILDFRVRPGLLLLSFLIFAFLQFSKGAMAINKYPIEVDKFLKLPDLTRSDMERYERIMLSTVHLTLAVSLLGIILFFYAVFSFFSVVKFYGGAILEVEQAKKGEQGSGHVS